MNREAFVLDFARRWAWLAAFFAMGGLYAWQRSRIRRGASGQMRSPTSQAGVGIVVALFFLLFALATSSGGDWAELVALLVLGVLWGIYVGSRRARGQQGTVEQEDARRAPEAARAFRRADPVRGGSVMLIVIAVMMATVRADWLGNWVLGTLVPMVLVAAGGAIFSGSLCTWLCARRGK